VGDWGGACGVWVGERMRERDHLEELDLNGRILLKWSIKIKEVLDYQC
jgi:hypothetical protein